MCDKEKRDCGCIHEILKKILLLQKEDFDDESCIGCDKPFLGPVCNRICFNTRPFMLFNCCTGNPWSFPFTDNGETHHSNIFRVEALDDCCVTCRILKKDRENDTLTGTGEFFTLDLECVGAIKCLADTFIDVC